MEISQFLTNKLQHVKINEHWGLDFYGEFDQLFLDGQSICSEVEKSLQPYLLMNKTFRLQLNFKSTPLLFGFFHEEKKVRVASSCLSSELFLLQQLEKEGHRELFQDLFQTEHYRLLKEHIEALAMLDVHHFPTVHQLTTEMGKLHQRIDFQTWQENVDPKVDETTQKLVDQLMVHLNDYSPSWFEKISDYGLGLTAQFALLRIHLLKFLAILPSLDHDHSGREVKRMLLEALRRLDNDSRKAQDLKLKGQERALPKNLRLVFKVVASIAGIVPAKFLANTIRSSVRLMAKRFIAGETIELAEKSFKSLFETGRDVTLDQLGELVVSEKEADLYCLEVLKLIRGFSQHIPKGQKNIAGVNRAHVSIKVSALCSDFKPEAFDYTYSLVAPRLVKILLAAKEEDVFINIDAEHYHYRDVVFEVYKKTLLETPELKDYKATGIVLQAYLRDAYWHLEQIADLARERGIRMPVRLVKGAYWDAETVEADAHNEVAPEFLNKEESDLNFRQMIHKIFDHGEHLTLCLASHNFSDHCYAEALKKRHYPKLGEMEHQCLHMTYEALSTAMAKMGWATRNYVPIGSLLVGMAYLVRRIMENSSQVGVLTIMRSHKKGAQLISPTQIHLKKIQEAAIDRDRTQVFLTEKFFNVTPIRLYLERERSWVNLGLKTFASTQLGRDYTKHDYQGEHHEVLCSSDLSLSVGKIKFATKEDALAAVKIADQAFMEHPWCQAGPKAWLYRANVLIKAAHLMLAKRVELSALISYEAGKTINEALADVDEAVDFIHFYVREEARLHKNDRYLRARGTTAVICPWNFPLAIPCGMSVSALVAGNPVLLKSAEQTPLIAQVYADLLHEAGVPQEVLIHLPGTGEDVGSTLTNSTEVASIVFTGSKYVGQLITQQASSRLYYNKKEKISYPVRVVCEMGGKNAIIVTGSAELDETVAGILYSAFGHAGQKCSAASRVIAHSSVITRLKERLREAVMDLNVGASFDFSTAVNPLIGAEDKQRIQQAAKESREEIKHYGGEVVVDRTQEEFPGHIVGPAIFEVPKSRALSPESWAMKEIFGPVVHMVAFDDLDEALHFYNGTEYALTGGVFSQSQDEIDYLSSKMESGNIYINRTITGARVAIEPFGGFKLSGTGPKAGGRGYLRNFHLSKKRALLSAQQLEEQRIERKEVVIPRDRKISAGLSASDFEFPLAHKSGLSALGRAERMERALEVIYARYERLFQQIDGDHKIVLERFQKWVRKYFVKFQTKEHANRRIPGQLSFNDYSLVQEHAVVIARRDRPAFITFMQTLSAVLMGTGVTVTALDEEAYYWWNEILEILNLAGFSRENIELYFVSESRFQAVVDDPMVSTFIFDGEQEYFEKELERIFAPVFSAKRMRFALSPYDSPNLRDFKRLCEHYVFARSFAVNTMRHGAPLTLDLK